MSAGILARLLAVLTLVLGLAAAIAATRDGPSTPTSFIPPASTAATSLRSELQRCRDLGEAAADDADCDAAWAESRDRFLMRDGGESEAR